MHEQLLQLILDPMLITEFLCHKISCVMLIYQYILSLPISYLHSYCQQFLSSSWMYSLFLLSFLSFFSISLWDPCRWVSLGITDWVPLGDGCLGFFHLTVLRHVLTLINILPFWVVHLLWVVVGWHLIVLGLVLVLLLRISLLVVLVVRIMNIRIVWVVLILLLVLWLVKCVIGHLGRLMLAVIIWGSHYLLISICILTQTYHLQELVLIETTIL